MAESSRRLSGLRLAHLQQKKRYFFNGVTLILTHVWVSSNPLMD